MSRTKILICDDHEIIHDTLGEYLHREGMEFVSAFDGNEALTLYAREQPQLLLLDIMLPGQNGLEICRAIRKISQTPIIMLTARGEELDRILGLEMGADDYIVKPFSPREVVVRIKTVMRRSLHAEKSGHLLEFYVLSLDIARYEARVLGHLIPFTAKEMELLFFLASQPGQVFSREQLLTEIWGYDYFGDTRLVDTQIRRVRQKLNQFHCPHTIKSLYGVGYKFEIADG